MRPSSVRRKLRKKSSAIPSYPACVIQRAAKSWQDYQARLDRVIDFIHDNLDEPLDLNRLAEIACLSPYHWHRVYQAMLGETAAATVRRLRLHRAAGDLIRTANSIDKIAPACGFNSVQAFSRAFRTSFGISPGEYRTRGAFISATPTRKDVSSHMYDVNLREIPPAKALTVLHTGPYMEIGRAFDHLLGWLVSHGAMRPAMRMIALYYDDPNAVPEAALRSRAGVVYQSNEMIESPFEWVETHGGPHAILRHRGPYAELSRAYQWLYGQWLPQSGKEAADAPVFEEYLNTPRDTAPPDLITDICLPLKL